MEISDYFIKGAIEYMREHEEYKDILPAYVSLFEKDECLNMIYQTTYMTTIKMVALIRASL